LHRPAGFGISYCQPNDPLELIQVERTTRSKAPTAVQQNAQAKAEGRCRIESFEPLFASLNVLVTISADPDIRVARARSLSEAKPNIGEIELAVAIGFIVNFRLTSARTTCGNGMISDARTAMTGLVMRISTRHCTPPLASPTMRQISDIHRMMALLRWFRRHFGDCCTGINALGPMPVA
jgi:hypothetical protein